MTFDAARLHACSLTNAHLEIVEFLGRFFGRATVSKVFWPNLSSCTHATPVMPREFRLAPRVGRYSQPGGPSEPSGFRDPSEKSD